MPLFYSKLNDELNPTFHSVLRNVIDTKMANAMPVEDLKRMLKSNGVKDEEMKWSFLDEFFRGETKVTKKEAQEWLDWNNLQIEEKMLESPDTHYSGWADPEGEDYHELLFKLPSDFDGIKRADIVTGKQIGRAHV